MLKSDQEPVVVDLLNRANSRRSAILFVEHSPRFSSQSNGVFERAIQSVQGQIRTTKDVFEGWLGAQGCYRRPDRRQFIVGGLVGKYLVVDRSEVWDDGKTSHERLRGAVLTF